MAVTDYTLAPGLIDHYDDTGALVPGLFHLNADGSVSFGEQTAVKGVSWTGVKPATVAGAGTGSGTFYSVVAPPGGDSSTAAGGAGGAVNFTTGAGGTSVTGGVKGGDFTINLGSGGGTGPSGQVIIISNETGTDNSGGTSNNTVKITPTITPGAAGGTQAYQGIYVYQILAGVGSRYGNFNAAAEFWNVNQSSGTIAGPVYGAEGTANNNQAGSTITQALGLQGNIIMSVAGTISTGTGVAADFQVIGGGVVSVAQGFNVAQTASAAAIYTAIYGYRCIGLWSDSAVSSGNSTVGGYNPIAAQFGVPIQGGNTSGTNNNYAVYILSQGSGGGTQVAGGVVNNWGVFVDRITNVAASNYGMQVKRHGATASTIGSLSNFGVSVEQPIGAGNTTGTINNYGFHSATVGTAGTSANGNVNNYGYYGEVPAGAAASGSGTVTNYGLRITGNGGTGTNWAIFSDSTASVRLDGQVITSRGVHKAATNNGLLSTSSAQSITLTAAILIGGFLDHTVTTGAATDTLDTGTNISAAIPGAAVGDSFVFVLNNSSASAFAITLAGATGATLKGSVTTIAQNKTGILTFVNTGANTWNVYVSVSA